MNNKKFISTAKNVIDLEIKALKNLHMRFTLRQLKWFDYDKIYKKMLSSPPPKKKKLRKDLNDLRQVVKNTPTTYISTIFVSAFV